uniref:Uncharacterized protein n=1 Tax=Arundo donax TaxID=35708 RepID=A0A0A9BEY3_ARUDO
MIKARSIEQITSHSSQFSMPSYCNDKWLHFLQPLLH